MKYFIKLYIILLSSLNLIAEPIIEGDIIIPESFKHTVTIPTTPPLVIENYIIDEEIIEETIEDELIIPESFKKSKHLTLENLSEAGSLPSTTFDPKETPISATKIHDHMNEWKKEIIEAEVTEEPVKINKPLLQEIDKDLDFPLENYEGTYRFVKGTTSLAGQITTLTEGLLFIEKLDENDFGFYYVIQRNEMAPTEKYGILHYKKERFFLKFIGDPIHRDNVKIKKSASQLETDMWDDKGEHAIQWELGSEEDINRLSPQLKAAFDIAKDNYTQIFKNNFTH